MGVTRIYWAVLTLLAARGCKAIGSYNDLIIREAARNAAFLHIRTEYCPRQWLQPLLERPPAPIVLESLNSSTAPNILFASTGLYLICLPVGKFSSELLDGLATTLHNKRQTKIIFYFPGTKISSNQLQETLRYCYIAKMRNVLVLIETINESYFTFSVYPQFKVEKRSYDVRPLFEKKFPNMHGHPLIIISDYAHPRTVINRNKQTGEITLTGSVGRFMNTLAWKLNATLQFPASITPGQPIHPKELQKLMKELHADVPAGTLPLLEAEQLSRSSYPWDIDRICLMIPMAKKIPRRDIYLLLLNSRNLLIAILMFYIFGTLLNLWKSLVDEQPWRYIDFIFSDVALRGMLGQSFKLVQRRSSFLKLIYLTLGIVGLNLSCLHEAHLGTLLTHAPKYPQLRTFDDVRRANFPLITTELDKDMFSYKELRMVILNWTDLEYRRSSLNTSFMYACSGLHYSLFQAQQNYFAQKLFLYSPDACFVTISIMSFFLPNNSWFVDPISELTLDVRANGMFDFWVDHHYSDMKTARLLSSKQSTKEEPLEAVLEFENLLWIWYIYVGFIIISCIIFAIELLIHRFNLKRKYSLYKLFNYYI